MLNLMKKRFFSVRVVLVSLVVVASSVSAQAKSDHPCAADALKQALKLLKFHNDNDDRAEVFDFSVKQVGSVAAVTGKGRFDVLQVDGAVYKGNYRMRLIYAQIPGTCALMGQEILETDNPY